MTYPRSPKDEARVQFLRDLSILDTSRNRALDRITDLCRRIFDVEITAVSLVDEDRQWFMSYQGLDVCETDRDSAFCNFTIVSPGIFEVTNALEHADFRDNPLVLQDPNIRYYAGAPLRYDDVPLGSLCLIDTRPRQALDERERGILEELAELVVHELKMARLLRQSLGLVASNSTDTDVRTSA